MTKAIVNGKIFDTETATWIGAVGAPSGVFAGDFEHWSADLYRAPNGTCFMDGDGGARSPFARPDGRNGWRGSSGIIELDPQDALAHAEAAELGVEVILAHFADLLVEA